MMSAGLRRESVLESIRVADVAVSASALAERFSVSRQVIVGDVALLRAQGFEIVATARGYVMPTLRDTNRFVGKAACSHDPADTRSELYCMVDLGAQVVDVIVEHEVYGEMTGQLNLRTRQDVDLFIDRVELSEIRLLSELTDGVHLHTLACRDKNHFDEVIQKLRNEGFLLQD